MSQPALSTDVDLRLTLQLDLRLHRAAPHASWSADLALPGQTPHLSFDSLPALIGYLARLDRPAPTGGLLPGLR